MFQTSNFNQSTSKNAIFRAVSWYEMKIGGELNSNPPKYIQFDTHICFFDIISNIII